MNKRDRKRMRRYLNPRRTPRVILLSIAVLFLLLLVVTVIDVNIQRAKTPRLVEEMFEGLEDTVNSYDLTMEQIDMLLTVEDPSFFEHHGTDFFTPGQGLTTITQAVGKKLYFHPFKPGIRKFRLVSLSQFALDPLVTKEDQLSLFLSILWYGNHDGEPIIGLGNAARTYYGKEIRDLEKREFLSLIAMIAAPTQFHLFDNKKNNDDRVARIEMVLSGEYVPKNLLDTYYDGAPVILPARDPIPLPDTSSIK